MIDDGSVSGANLPGGKMRCEEEINEAAGLININLSLVEAFISSACPITSAATFALKTNKELKRYNTATLIEEGIGNGGSRLTPTMNIIELSDDEADESTLLPTFFVDRIVDGWRGANTTQ